VSLLAGQTLRVAPAFGLIAQAEPAQAGQPTPPPAPPGGYEAPPPSAQPPANLVPDEEPPSLGAVLGFMISGGVVGVTGVGFILGGLVYLLAGSVTQGVGGTTQAESSAITIAGVVLICLGLAMDGVAVFLLLHGNSLRVKRAAYNEQHGITDGSDLPPRAPSAAWQPGLAWSF